MKITGQLRGLQAWAEFDVYLPERWADDLPLRHAAGIPADLEFTTNSQLAIGQPQRPTAAGLPARWGGRRRGLWPWR